MQRRQGLDCWHRRRRSSALLPMTSSNGAVVVIREGGGTRAAEVGTWPHLQGAPRLASSSFQALMIISIKVQRSPLSNRPSSPPSPCPKRRTKIPHPSFIFDSFRFPWAALHSLCRSSWTSTVTVRAVALHAVRSSFPVLLPPLHPLLPRTSAPRNIASSVLTTLSSELRDFVCPLRLRLPYTHQSQTAQASSPPNIHFLSERTVQNKAGPTSHQLRMSSSTSIRPITRITHTTPEHVFVSPAVPFLLHCSHLAASSDHSPPHHASMSPMQAMLILWSCRTQGSRWPLPSWNVASAHQHHLHLEQCFLPSPPSLELPRVQMYRLGGYSVGQRCLYPT